MSEKYEFEDWFMNLNEVIKVTGRSRSSIYRDIESGSFPTPLKTGPKSNGWPASVIRKWMKELPHRKDLK